MKKLALAITIAAIAISGSAFAQGTVGVYFDTDATETYTAVSEITVLHAYCIANDVPGFGVAGFELALSSSGPLAISNFEFPAGSGAINIQSAPTFLVGFSGPIPAVNGAVMLVEFDVLAYSANTANWTEYDYDINNDEDNAYEARIFTNAIFFHSLPDPVPAYLDENGEILPLTRAISNQYRNYDFTVIELIIGPVATDEASWDGVKSLYR